MTSAGSAREGKWLLILAGGGDSGAPGYRCGKVTNRKRHQHTGASPGVASSWSTGREWGGPRAREERRLDTDFRPHPLLWSGHAQTLYAGLGYSSAPVHAARPHLLPASEGDRLVLHDDLPPQWHAGGTCALLLHGLGGCHRSPYMARTAAKLAARGVRTFRLDLRGCGDGYRLAVQPGHAGRSEDALAAVVRIGELCPTSPLVLVGYSLGANILLKMLGECRERVPRHIAGAVAVAPPLDLLACSQNLHRPGRAAYQRWFVRSLVSTTNERRRWVPAVAQLDLSRPPRSVFEFDDRVTAPLSGFTGARDYYQRCSAIHVLADIRVPTTIVAAADDPIVPVAIFDHRCTTRDVELRVTRRGGHVGYYGRAGRDPDRHWLDWRIVEFVLGRST